MKQENLTISPTEELKPVLDYNLLQELGRQYIEKLGHTYWTDYNTHDPGITILETLCYALTELGYRMQFPVPDLLEEAPGVTPKDDTRFTARDILTTHPVTVLDYRKLLIDLNGVANAWLSKVTNPKPELFIDCKDEKLSFEETQHQIKVKGIWDVLLELESNDAFGDLNAAEINYTIAEGVLKGKTITFIPHQRVDIEWKAFLGGQLKSVTIDDWVKETNTSWSATLIYKFLVNGSPVYNRIQATIIGKELDHNNPDTALKNVLKKVTPDTLQDVYIRREQTVLSILRQVQNTLNEHRNLCEDFRNIGLVSSEEISFCADIETEPDTDLELIEAQIILAIENYLTPKVDFYSLQEMQQAGHTSDEIFDGPALTHGFIDTDELANSQLRQAVYTSDVINLIMDIEGVVTVSNFVMSKFGADGQLVKKAERWALSITKNHKPRYSKLKSKWTFLKNNIPFATRDSEVEDILQLLKAEEERGKLLNRLLDLDLPEGVYRELDSYFTIQNDLPATYGVGQLGFPSNADTARKAQAKQLQGYLQFYDQILANMLKQVEQFKDYISLDETVEFTYYSKFLDELPASDYIYKDAVALQNQLGELAEDEDTFLLRRNRILDHLLNRFQESFNDYVLLLFDLDGEEKANAELILDKIRFLKDYPETSSRRFVGVNYTKAANWPYLGSAGIKMRVSRLAGINNVSERYVMPIRLSLKPVGPPADDKWRILWKDRVTDTTLFTSSKIIEGRNEAYLNARRGFQRFVEGSYSTKKAGSKWRTVFGKNMYAHRSSKLFASEEEATEFGMTWFNALNAAEGMNIFEHILLRPRSIGDYLMDVCVPDNCRMCGDEDPYSFKFSVMLPYWPEKFRIMHYRRHLEKLVHVESPAHLFPKVCWADPFAWQELEDAYNSWLSAHQQENEEEIKQATARLIKALESVDTVYPEAVLHDCEDDKDENPVILNQTKLGIF